jgi:hypothetical protein
MFRRVLKSHRQADYVMRKKHVCYVINIERYLVLHKIISDQIRFSAVINNIFYYNFKSYFNIIPLKILCQHEISLDSNNIVT